MTRQLEQTVARDFFGAGGRREAPDPGSRDAVAAVSSGEALRAWSAVAAQSFGGPAGQIAVIHRIVVDERKWISEERFLHALSYCMLLPGPEAQQLATYLGWLTRGIRGGLVAGGLFILPGFLSILALSFVYVLWRDVPVVEGLLFGLKPAVMAIVAQAVARLGKRALLDTMRRALAALAFVAIYAFDVPFPWIVVAAGALGAVLLRGGEGDGAAAPGRPVSWRRTALVLGVGLLLWALPMLALAGALGTGHTLVQEGVFFSTAALVTFGGAYAVLAYVAQQAVEAYGWLQPLEMLDGLGLAETTPGPLVQVVQFVGFMGAYRFPEPFHPLVAGVAGSLVTTWVTFVPSFLFIFVGAPYIERVRGHRLLTAALSGVTAAVVGVVLNLGVWFGVHTLFAEVRTWTAGPLAMPVPVWGTWDAAAMVVAVGAAVAIFRFRTGMLPTLAGGAVAGALLRLVMPG